MNSRERVWSALNLEAVDRVPIHAVAVDGNICDKVLGKPPRTAFDIIDEFEEQYPNEWVERVNNIIAEIEINVFSRAIEAATIIGYDTCELGNTPLPYYLHWKTASRTFFRKNCLHRSYITLFSNFWDFRAINVDASIVVCSKCCNDWSCSTIHYYSGDYSWVIRLLWL